MRFILVAAILALSFFITGCDNGLHKGRYKRYKKPGYYKTHPSKGHYKKKKYCH